MTLYYTGIGSRKTPSDICGLMTKIAIKLCEQNFVLRSGRAQGADQAFELGSGVRNQIFLPWPAFEINFKGIGTTYGKPTKEAYSLANRFHPNWLHISNGARSLHARNMHQILGPNLDDPSMFIICWTENGIEKGGTAQALRAARHFKIPVYNLGLSKSRFELETNTDIESIYRWLIY